MEESTDTSSGSLYKELKAKTDYKDLKVAHLNVRGVFKIRLLLLDSNLDVLAITEAHLQCDINSSEISVDGYKRADLLTDRQAVWINITCVSQQFIIGFIYYYSQFYEILYTTLEKIWMKRKKYSARGGLQC